MARAGAGWRIRARHRMARGTVMPDDARPRRTFAPRRLPMSRLVCLTAAYVIVTAVGAAPATAQQPSSTTARPAAAETRTVKRYAPEDFFKTVSYAGASFSPDGSKILVSS